METDRRLSRDPGAPAAIVGSGDDPESDSADLGVGADLTTSDVRDE